MSKLDRHTALASPVNTVTQKFSIADQLKAGSRYFDLRPVISGGRYTTGHYGYIDTFGVGWQGGNGQDFEEIIKQINDFTAKYKELIVLDLTHGYNTDDFAGKGDSGLSQAQWDTLLNRLKAINNRAVTLGKSGDITNLKLSQLMGRNATVLIRVDDITKTRKGVDTSRFRADGIFDSKQFPLINDYADTDDYKKMSADQFGVLSRSRTSPTSPMMILSWTLTQGGFFNAVSSIVDAGDDVNKALPELLWPKVNTRTYPNILMVDAYPKHHDIAALAVAMNLWLTRVC
jgi:hypothetical protein